MNMIQFINKFRNSKLVPIEEYEQLENWAEYTVDYHSLVEANEILKCEICELKERNEELQKALIECENRLSSKKDLNE